MTFRQAEYILEIAKTGSITKAAENLHLSQPALSQCLSSVEKGMGTFIFEKGHSPLIPTYAGEKILKAASEILRLTENIDKEIQDIRNEQAGRIKFGISMLRGAAYLPTIISEFSKNHPGVEICIIECGSAESADLVLNGSVDMAIISTDEISQSKMVMESLCEDTSFILAGLENRKFHDIPNGTEVSVSILEGSPVVKIKSGHGVNITQTKVYSALKVQPEIKYEVESIILAARLVEATETTVICPASVMQTVMRPNLKAYPLKEKNYSNTVCLGYLHNSYKPKYVVDFMKIVRNTIRTDSLYQESR